MSCNKIQLNIARLVLVALALLLILPYCPTAHAAEASGTCGSGVEWSLSGGVLTISGSGSMANYNELSLAPWQGYKDSILSVVVENGVTNVGNLAFFKMDKLKTVRLADSVQTIGDWAFYYCSSLTIVELGSVNEIGESAFERCLSLTGIRLPSTLQTLRYHAFYRCENLLSITIPAAVTNMETSVFAYCINLRSASVMANISELPLWTFYGCEALQSVSLSSNITEIGTQAFHNCDSLSRTVYGGSQKQIQEQMPQVETFIAFMEPAEDDFVEVSTVVTETLEDGSTVTTESYFTSSESCSINTQTIRTSDSVAVTIDAVLENADGWENVAQQVALSDLDTQQVTANVYLKSDSALSGADLRRFAGKDIRLTIHTSQGAQWFVNGVDLVYTELSDNYDLSFTLLELTDPTKEQVETLNGQKGYSLVFHGQIDFMVEVELPIGQTYSRQSAVFFSNEEGGYQRMQAVMIDDAGLAHFYLGQIQPDVEYLIGVNVPQQGAQDTVIDVIIPDSLKNEYPKLEQTEQIEYVITGVNSSWGMNFGQVSLILAAVMVVSMIVVGIVMFISFKRKLKNGYVPDMSYADEHHDT